MSICVFWFPVQLLHPPRWSGHWAVVDAGIFIVIIFVFVILLCFVIFLYIYFFFIILFVFFVFFCLF